MIELVFIAGLSAIILTAIVWIYDLIELSLLRGASQQLTYENLQHTHKRFQKPAVLMMPRAKQVARSLPNIQK